MAGVLSPTENQIFDDVWALLRAALDVAVVPDANIIKGFQNLITAPTGTYVVISPGVLTRQNAGLRSYDTTANTIIEGRHSTYAYQVDAFGPNAPDVANLLSLVWRSEWATDYVNTAGLHFQVLYADEPKQLNIANSENMYEQRFMSMLYLQVNQTVTLPQAFANIPPAVVISPPADDAPL